MKRKGTAGENELVDILKSYQIRAYRNDQIFRGGIGNPDVYAEIADESMHIEVKRVEKLNVTEAMKKTMRDAKPGALPVLVHRRNHEKWLVTIPLYYLLQFLRKKEVI